MPKMPDWHFGMVLKNSHTEEIALFLRIDNDRTRMLGGTTQWIGMRLKSGRYAPKGQQPGAVGNYSLPNWKLVEDLSDAADIAVPTIFSGHTRGSGGRIIDPSVAITGITTTDDGGGTITTTVTYEKK